MNITEIRVRKIITEGKLRGIVSITIDNVLAIHDIKIVQGEERLFTAMPSRRDDNGMFRDIVHPINSEVRKDMENQIISAYKMEVDRQNVESDSSDSWQPLFAVLKNYICQNKNKKWSIKN